MCIEVWGIFSTHRTYHVSPLPKPASCKCDFTNGGGPGCDHRIKVSLKRLPAVLPPFLRPARHSGLLKYDFDLQIRIRRRGQLDDSREKIFEIRGVTHGEKHGERVLPEMLCCKLAQGNRRQHRELSGVFVRRMLMTLGRLASAKAA